jgi:hypothetical protein
VADGESASLSKISRRASLDAKNSSLPTMPHNFCTSCESHFQVSVKLVHVCLWRLYIVYDREKVGWGCRHLDVGSREAAEWRNKWGQEAKGLPWWG